MLAYHFSLLFIFFVPLFLQSVARRQSSATFMWLLSVSAVMSLSFLPSISPSQFVTPNINFKKKKSLSNLQRKLRVKQELKMKSLQSRVESFLKLKIIRTIVRLQSVSVLMTLGLTWLAACRASITVGGGGVLLSRPGGRGGLLRWINQLFPVRLTVIVLEVRTNRLSLQPQTGL